MSELRWFDLISLVTGIVPFLDINISLERKIWVSVVLMLVYIAVRLAFALTKLKKDFVSKHDASDKLEQKHKALATQYSSLSAENAKYETLIREIIGTLRMGKSKTTKEGRDFVCAAYDQVLRFYLAIQNGEKEWDNETTESDTDN